MRIISRRTLREFWGKHAEAQPALEAWYTLTKQAEWHKPADIKRLHRNASFVGDDRVVFNIKGNSYRLVVRVNYLRGAVYIRFVGTHDAYNKIDVATI